MQWRECDASAYVEFQSMAQANICEAAWIEVTPPPSFKQPLQSHATPFLVTTPPHDYHGKALCKGDGGGCIIAKPEAHKSKPQPTNAATSCPPAKLQPYCPDPPPSCLPPIPPPNYHPPSKPSGTSLPSNYYRALPVKRKFVSDEIAGYPSAPAAPKAMPLPLTTDEEWSEHLIPDSMRLQPGEQYPFPMEV